MTTNKRFSYDVFEITDKFIGDKELKLYQIDNNPTNDLDEENLFYLYSTSKENVEAIVDKLNEQKEEISNLQLIIGVNGKAYRKSVKEYEEFIEELEQENEQLKKENERLKHDNQVLIQFKNITIKTLQGVKDNNGNNGYTSALMDSIANELGEDLE